MVRCGARGGSGAALVGEVPRREPQRRAVGAVPRAGLERDVAAVDRFLAEQYTIHSDPGDPWDGQTPSREAFKSRLTTSRAPFPDLRFEPDDVIADGYRVAVSWMRGTQLGALADRPPTGRSIDVQGMRIYYFVEGRI